MVIITHGIDLLYSIAMMSQSVTLKTFASKRLLKKLCKDVNGVITCDENNSIFSALYKSAWVWSKMHMTGS